MSKERLDATIKTRVPTPIKAAFDRLAAARNLDAADLQREAMREWLAKNDLTPAEKEKVAA